MLRLHAVVLDLGRLTRSCTQVATPLRPVLARPVPTRLVGPATLAALVGLVAALVGPATLAALTGLVAALVGPATLAALTRLVAALVPATLNTVRRLARPVRIPTIVGPGYRRWVC